MCVTFSLNIPDGNDFSHHNIQGETRSGSARRARSQGCSTWSNILGANRRLANAKSSMLQENNPAAASMYVHTSFDLYSDRHVLGLLLCPGVICVVLRCARGTAVDTQQHARTHNEKNEKTGKKTKKNVKKAKKFRKVPQQILLSAITGQEGLTGGRIYRGCSPK